jgi:hypothetical protein
MAIQDVNEYWCITEYGAEIYKQIRKGILLQSLGAVSDKQGEDANKKGD